MPGDRWMAQLSRVHQERGKGRGMGTIRGRVLRAGPLLVFLLCTVGLGCEGRGEGGEEGLGGEVESAATTPGTDAAEVTHLAHDFMDALSQRNTTRLDELLADHARLFSIREGDGGPQYAVRSREEFLQGLAEGGTAFVERIWEPTVEVSGRIAMVWAPYDFHLDGEFSHCGIDVLAFMKMAEGWKVTSITYNVVREGCPESPLGARSP